MVDARGYSCPLPVLMTQKAVDKTQPNTLEVWVDNQAAVQNVTRFAGSRKYSVDVKEADGDYILTLTKA